MDYHIIPDHLPSVSFAHAAYEHAPIAMARLSIDLHREQSLFTEATRLVYSEALLAGAGDYSREDFLDAIGKLGASLTVHCTDGVLTIELSSTRDQFSKLCRLLSTMFESPTFEPKEIARIKRSLHNQLHDHVETARERANDGLRSLLFSERDRRYRFDPIRLATALADVNVRELAELHEMVRSSYLYASVLGNDTSANALTKTLKQLSSTRAISCRPPGVHAPEQSRTHVACVDLPGRTNVEFSIGGPLPLTFHHPDFLPFVFGLNVLGKPGGFAGRLMQQVREAQGLTYMIYARTETVTGTETGYWRIFTFFSPADLERGLAATAQEISTMYESGVTEEEFARFRNIHHTQLALIADAPSRRLDDLHSFHLAGLSVPEIEQYKQRFLAVSLEEVNRALRTHLLPSATFLGAAGPLQGVEKHIKKTFGRGIL